MATALTIASTVVSTMGGMAGAQQEKMAAKSRAKMAEIQSDQTQASSLDDLRRQVSNIKAIRASAGASAQSPTTQAIIDAERKISAENLEKRKAAYRLEALQARADAKLIQQKNMMTILGGGLSIGRSLATM